MPAAEDAIIELTQSLQRPAFFHRFCIPGLHHERFEKERGRLPRRGGQEDCFVVQSGDDVHLPRAARRLSHEQEGDARRRAPRQLRFCASFDFQGFVPWHLSMSVLSRKVSSASLSSELTLGIPHLPRQYAVNGAVCGRLHYIYTELPRDVRGVVTIDTFVTFFKIRQVYFLIRQLSMAL